MTPLIELKNAEKEYPLGNTRVRALRNVTLDVAAGEMVVIAGPSGSGKTTLLNLVGCIDVPTRGTVRIDGELTFNLTDQEFTCLRREKIGFIFQSFNLVPVLNVVENIELPLLVQGGEGTTSRRRRVAELLERVGLAAHAHHRPTELSGGQRQRVAIARALVHRPKLVIADEPTANLDSVTGQVIVDLARELQRTEKTTFLIATHDANVMRHAERVVSMHDGAIANGPPDQGRRGSTPGTGGSPSESSSSSFSSSSFRSIT